MTALEFFSVQIPELSHIQVPLEVDGVRDALCELERRIAAWTHVVSEVERRLDGASWSQGTVVRHETERPEQPPSPQQVDTAGPPVAAALLQPVIKAVAADPDDGSTSEDARHAAMEDMLKALDPKTAHAIRVQWRLLNGRIGVEELIRRHQATALRSAKSGRDSWWKRVTG